MPERQRGIVDTPDACVPIAPPAASTYGTVHGLTLLNNTSFDAHFRVMKGGQVVTSVLAIPKNASVQIRTENSYAVTASAIVDGNVYTSAPMSMDGSGSFQAQVIQNTAGSSTVFDMVKVASSRPDQLQFEKTCLSDVTFTISRDGKALQNITVTDSFTQACLALSDTYSISAVINGVTTEPVTTDNVNATIRAADDPSAPGNSYFTLELR